MARSSYIYLVKKHPSRHVLGAFTGKHECARGIKRNLSEHECISVWRYKDNSMVSLPDLIAEGTTVKVLEKL